MLLGLFLFLRVMCFCPLYTYCCRSHVLLRPPRRRPLSSDLSPRVFVEGDVLGSSEGRLALRE